jgi:hypothetical protein
MLFLKYLLLFFNTNKTNLDEHFDPFILTFYRFLTIQSERKNLQARN